MTPFFLQFYTMAFADSECLLDFISRIYVSGPENQFHSASPPVAARTTNWQAILAKYTSSYCLCKCYFWPWIFLCSMQLRGVLNCLEKMWTSKYVQFGLMCHQPFLSLSLSTDAHIEQYAHQRETRQYPVTLLVSRTRCCSGLFIGR